MTIRTPQMAQERHLWARRLHRTLRLPASGGTRHAEVKGRTKRGGSRAIAGRELLDGPRTGPAGTSAGPQSRQGMALLATGANDLASGWSEKRLTGTTSEQWAGC